jgi:hypothetical protein
MRPERMNRAGSLWVGLLSAWLGAMMTACAGVDVVPLTEQSFPSKGSGHEVEVLEHEPSCPHILLADLAIEGEANEFQHLKTRILEQAASLGADAVVFTKSQQQIHHQVAYQTYPAWNFGGWMYGSYPYGYGYYGGWPISGGDVAVSHEVTKQSLAGTAIRYASAQGRKC